MKKTKRERKEMKRREAAYLRWYQQACFEERFPEEAPHWQDVAQRLYRALDIVLPAVRGDRRHLIVAALDHYEHAEAVEGRLRESFARGEYVFVPEGTIQPADMPKPKE